MIIAPYYHRTIRKYVTAFGSMFDNITLIRYDDTGTIAQERMKVPLSYANKEKYIVRITSDPTLTKSIAIVLPRMSFEMTNISYDNSRKQMTTLKNYGAKDSMGAHSQYIGVPYNFDFSLYLYVRNIEDGTQIVEQILPYFTPDYSMTVNLIPEIGLRKDLPLILNSVENQIDTEGDFSTTRYIIWTLNFTMKGYVYGPVSDSKMIKHAQQNIFELKDALAIQNLNLANTGSGMFLDGEIVRVEGKGAYGKVLTWNTAANTQFTLQITDATQIFSVNDVVVGDESRATYTISSLSVTPLKLVQYDVEPSPNTAMANGSYTYSESFLEFPHIP